MRVSTLLFAGFGAATAFSVGPSQISSTGMRTTVPVSFASTIDTNTESDQLSPEDATASELSALEMTVSY